MLAANNWYCITRQSCCCQMPHIDLHQKTPVKPVEHSANSTSLQCQCKPIDCSHDAGHLSQVVTLQCPQSQDVLNVMHREDLHCTFLSSPGARHVQCTCRAEASVAQCAACVCHHRATKPADVIHVVRCDESGTKPAADYCTCVGKFSEDRGTSSSHHAVSLSDGMSCVLPPCTQVKRSPQPTSAHSGGVHSLQQKQEISSNSCSCEQSRGVTIVDVSEWQRRHIEELHRQKLEILGSTDSAGEQHLGHPADSETPETSSSDAVMHRPSVFMPLDGSPARPCPGNCALAEEVDRLQSEMIAEQKKVKFYQAVLESTQAELESFQASSAGEAVSDMPVSLQSDQLMNFGSCEMDLDGSTSAGLEAADASASSVSSENTLVSSNGCSTSASVTETDEGVGIEDLSQLIGSSPRQDQLQHTVTDYCPPFHVLSLHQQVLRKNKQLRFLKQMLKELSSSHESLLEKYMVTLNQRVSDAGTTQSADTCAITSELQLCVSKLRPIIDICSAVVLNDHTTPDFTALLDSNARRVEAQWNQTELTENVTSLHTAIDELTRATLNKLIAAHHL